MDQNDVMITKQHFLTLCHAVEQMHQHHSETAIRLCGVDDQRFDESKGTEQIAGILKDIYDFMIHVSLCRCIQCQLLSALL